MGRPRGAPSTIHHVHIADGFTDDCEELIHRWLRTNTLTYETFCEIWKDMQFSFLYHGRTSGAEMAELSEEMLNIAKHYMVSNTDNFEESVAGLFLVYALLRLQPYARFAALRLVPDDVPALTRIETVARRERRYDVLYILGSVLIEGPVQYHAVNRERGMEITIRKYLDGTTGVDRLGVRPKGVFRRQNEESDLLRELNSITKRYVEAKKAVAGENCVGLNYTDEGLATDLDRSLKEIINGIIDDTPESNKKMQDHYSRVQVIKEKAMKQAVDSVKHLATVTNGPSSSGSQTSRRRKRRSKPSLDNCLRPIAKRKRKASSSSSEESEASSLPSLHSSDEDLDTDDQTRDVEDKESYHEIEIDIPNTNEGTEVDTLTDTNQETDTLTDTNQDKEKDSAEPSKEIGEDVQKQAEETTNTGPNEEAEKEKDNTESYQEKEIDIQIDSLPVLIRSEQNGDFIEIEVIDNLEKPKTSKTPVEDTKCSKRSAKRKIKKLPGVTLEKLESGEGPSGNEGTEKKKELERLKKREKRELKKPAIMSKFKRMGMLKMVDCSDGDEGTSKELGNSDKT